MHANSKILVVWFCDADGTGHNRTFYVYITDAVAYCISPAPGRNDSPIDRRNCVTIYYSTGSIVVVVSLRFFAIPRAYKRLWSSKLNVNGICTTARCSASQTHRGDETKKAQETKKKQKKSVHCCGDHLSWHEWPRPRYTHGARAKPIHTIDRGSIHSGSMCTRAHDQAQTPSRSIRQTHGSCALGYRRTENASLIPPPNSANQCSMVKRFECIWFWVFTFFLSSSQPHRPISVRQAWPKLLYQW